MGDKYCPIWAHRKYAVQLWPYFLGLSRHGIHITASIRTVNSGAEDNSKGQTPYFIYLDGWNRTSPTSTNINLHSWMLNNRIAYELTMDCELIAQPHSLTFVLSNPTRTRTMAVTGCQLIWNFKAHVKTDKFVENESVNQRYWGSGGQQVRLLEPLVRILTSELPWYWPFEVRFEGPYPFWIRLRTVRSGQVQGSGKWSNLRPEPLSRSRFTQQKPDGTGLR